jgi:PIF1-like helicase
MQHRFAFEAVDRLLRYMRRNDDDLFGGVPAVFGGDWAQTLPVVPRGNRAQITAACLCRSYIWDHLEVLTLRQNMRLQGDADGVNVQFANWLTGLSQNPDMVGPITLPTYLPRAPKLDDLCETIFPLAELANPARDPDFFANRAILAIRNDQLPPVNDMLLEHLPAELRKYYAVDSAFTEAGDPAQEATSEFLRTVEVPGLPSSVVRDAFKGRCARDADAQYESPGRSLQRHTVDHHQAGTEGDRGEDLDWRLQGLTTLYSTHSPVFPLR